MGHKWLIPAVIFNLILFVISCTCLYQLKQEKNRETNDFAAYGNYSDQEFAEAVRNNPIDKAYLATQFGSTYEGIEGNLWYADQWKYEVDMTLDALKRLKEIENAEMENVDDLTSALEKMEDLRDCAYGYIKKRTELETDIYQDNYSRQWPQIYFTEACEIRSLALSLKEYYYNATGTILFFYQTD